MHCTGHLLGLFMDPMFRLKSGAGQPGWLAPVLTVVVDDDDDATVDDAVGPDVE